MWQCSTLCCYKFLASVPVHPSCTCNWTVFKKIPSGCLGFREELMIVHRNTEFPSLYMLAVKVFNHTTTEETGKNTIFRTAWSVVHHYRVNLRIHRSISFYILTLLYFWYVECRLRVCAFPQQENAVWNTLTLRNASIESQQELGIH